MAIVSISRIQIRRGRKNQGSGLPQLAGGELGWAVDTQELYIGNGAVSEGAPAVGNSKILTEHDNLFELSDQYTYKCIDHLIQIGYRVLLRFCYYLLLVRLLILHHYLCIVLEYQLPNQVHRPLIGVSLNLGSFDLYVSVFLILKQ